MNLSSSSSLAAAVGVSLVAAVGVIYLLSASEQDELEDAVKSHKSHRSKKHHKTSSTSTTAPPEEERQEERVGGMQNIGNTCFLNATLQALSACPSFRIYLQQLSQGTYLHIHVLVYPGLLCISFLFASTYAYVRIAS